MAITHFDKMLLEYISTEEREDLYIDGVSTDEISVNSLIDISKACIQSIKDKPKDDLISFIINVISVFGEPTFIRHCDECGDNVYDYTLKVFNKYEAIYTEGCVCYGLRINGEDCENPNITQNDLWEFLCEACNHICDEKQKIVCLLIDFMNNFGIFDEKLFNENIAQNTYSEKYIYEIK